MSKIRVLELDVSVISVREEDFICLTDIARYKNEYATDDLIRNWLRNRNTLEFLGIWERLNNPAFNPVAFDGIKSQAGLNSFTLTPKQWIEKTGAIGITSKAGRYGGTFAHKDIAFEFASWISVEFKLYLIKEFQRLKEQEQKTLGWDIRRNLAKINYRIHTDAIQTHLIPPQLTKPQAALVYASEADVLNMALFGQTAAQWRQEHPKEKGNIRDQANSAQLVCLSNLENLNALFISPRLHPGGMPAISRGLSAATPPDGMNLRDCIPAGCQPISLRPRWGRNHVGFTYRGRRCAQPPANRCQASGLKSCRQSPSSQSTCQTHIPHPGGMPAISRGLSAATPPDMKPPTNAPRQGCQQRGITTNDADATVIAALDAESAEVLQTIRGLI